MLREEIIVPAEILVFQIDFKGTWFSGHSVTIKGIYQDNSSPIKTYHHVKLVASSPHFNETNIDLRYWRDQSELSLDLEVFNWIVIITSHCSAIKLVFADKLWRKSVWPVAKTFRSNGQSTHFHGKIKNY